jgi:hypothetical protein
MMKIEGMRTGGMKIEDIGKHHGEWHDNKKYKGRKQEECHHDDRYDD